MAYEFYLGLDAHSGEDGKVSYTLCLVEKDQNNGKVTYRLHDLRRLDGAADEIASEIQDEISRDPFVGRTVCIANATEDAGAEVHHALNELGLSPIAMRISGGDAATQTGSGLDLEGGDSAGTDQPGLQVSEHEIVANVEEIYHDGRFDLQAVKTDESSRLAHGLDKYRLASREPGQEGLDSISPEPTRDTEDADAVLAAGVACWLAEQHSFDPTEHLAGEAPPIGEAKREMRPDTT